MTHDAENLASRGAWTTGYSQAPVSQDLQTARVGCSVDGLKTTSRSADNHTSKENGNSDSHPFAGRLGRGIHSDGEN